MIDPSRIAAHVQDHPAGAEGVGFLERLQRQTVRGQVVFTNGVFDLLHRGHVDVIN